MKTVGIICEYNPFHLGHKKQFDLLRARYGDDCAIVCLMSGNYVQRGEPAIFDKALRCRAALEAGADLVLELPTQGCLSSAEGFAAMGVTILSRLCQELCFGTESGTKDTLLETAQALLDSRFPALLRRHLDTGISFPAARSKTLEDMGLGAKLLEQPNDILAVEYCKAILSQNAPLEPMPIPRQGSYHGVTADKENPSATFVRQSIIHGQDYSAYVPEAVAAIFAHARIHTLSAGETAMLCKLRSMTDSEFEALPYGSEGLWRKLMHACRKENSVQAILSATKSKRYTHTRLSRMVMCAYLGITQDMLAAPAPYVRVLGLKNKGREILKAARKQGCFLHTGEETDHPYWLLEQRWSDLYGLFAQGAPECAGLEAQRRILYL